MPRSADQVNAMPIGPPTGEAASWPSGCGVRPEMAEFLERIAKLSPKRLALLAADLQAKVDDLERACTEPIAIIGHGRPLPRRGNPEAFREGDLSGKHASPPRDGESSGSRVATEGPRPPRPESICKRERP